LDFMEVIKTRRSIRRYKPDPVPDEVLNQVLEAARLAPSAANLQSWHFIVVKDSETKRKLGLASWASEAPIVIVGCGDADLSSRWFMVDLAIAFEHIILAATNLGLGTCWIGKLGIDETIKKVLGIPEHIKVVAVTPLGYPAETPGSKTRKHLSEIVHYGKF
jgi:nitroreductase